jgi:hypothetical protein
MIQDNESARPAGARRRGLSFRQAAVFALIPLAALACEFLFITLHAEPACLHVLGTLGVCDPLHYVNAVGIAGQLIAIAGAMTVLWRSRRQERSGALYLIVTCSLIWAGLIMLIAFQWTTSGPG